MSAPAETVAAAPVEDVKPVETPAAEPAPAAVEEPKVEEPAPAATEAPAAEEPKAEVSFRRVTRSDSSTDALIKEPAAPAPATETTEAPAAPAEPAAAEEAKPVRNDSFLMVFVLIVSTGRGGPQEGREARAAQEPRFPRQDSCSLQEWREED